MMWKRAISCGGRVQTYTEEEGNRVGKAGQTDAEEEGNQSAEEKGNQMRKKRANRSYLRKRATRCWGRGHPGVDEGTTKCLARGQTDAEKESKQTLRKRAIRCGEGMNKI